MGAGFLCLCLNLNQQAIAKIIAKISNRIKIQISNICHQCNCVSCTWFSSCAVDSGGGQKRKHHCTIKNSNKIINTVYRSIQTGIKAVFKLKHTPIRHNIMTREATIQFFQNRSDTAKSEDRPIPIQYDTSAVFFFM